MLKKNGTNEPTSNSVSIQISNKHRLGHDGTQWILWTALGNPKDKDNIKYKPCYPSTLKYALELVSKDELFEAIDNFHVFKDLSDKFDEMFKNPYEDRETAITTWFGSIVLTDEVEKKYNVRCRELSKLRSEFKQFKIDHGFDREEKI